MEAGYHERNVLRQGEKWLEHENVKNADLVAWQEIHLREHDCRALRDRLKSKGWHAFIAPSKITQAEGTCGRVGYPHREATGPATAYFPPRQSCC